jgi:hypothetical protein
VFITRGGGHSTEGIDVKTEEGDHITIKTGSKGNHNHEAKLITCPQCGGTISSDGEILYSLPMGLTDETLNSLR